MSTDKVLNALGLIGKNESLRNSFVKWCLSVEDGLDYKGSSRDDLTKFLVDAVYKDVPVVRKSIKSGLAFEFIPNIHSKVAREFIMSQPETPDHVWEPQTSRLLMILSAGAKNVIIGGAYFGDQAILIANQIISNEGKVHAFELNSKQSQILSNNAKINHLNNINVVNKGLWSDDNTFLNLSNDDDLAFASPETVENGLIANTVTIDKYLKGNDIHSVDVIMLDIEGSEFEVLKGAANTLSMPPGKAPNIVFEVHRSYTDWSDGLHNTDIVKYLKSFGYTLYSIRDFQANFDLKGRPIELILPEDTYLEGPPHGFNMLAIKDASLIDNDQFRICKNVSPKYLIHKSPDLHHPIDGLQ